MNVGEALAHGLLGGTAAAADHYVSDWRDRTKRARDLAAQKEGWQFQAEQAEKQRAHSSSEAAKERGFRSGERKAEQLYRSGEADKERTFRSGEADKDRSFRNTQAWEDRNFKAGQADADVQRRLQLAQGEADIKEQYRDKGMLFTMDKDGKLIPVTPDSEGFAAPVAQQLNGQFSYFGVGADGKGLLKGKSSGSGKGAGGYETLKTPGQGGITMERTIYRDADTGKEYTYAVDPQTQLPIRVPLEAGQQAPATPEAVAQADAFAEQTVNDLAGWFSSDATNFEPWGGSRSAAKEYFRQGYLNGTLFDDQGKLMMPGQERTEKASPDTAGEDAQVASVQLYQSLNPEKQQYVQLFINHINQGSDRDLMIQRMIELGFTEQELSVLFPAI